MRRGDTDSIAEISSELGLGWVRVTWISLRLRNVIVFQSFHRKRVALDEGKESQLYLFDISHTSIYDERVSSRSKRPRPLGLIPDFQSELCVRPADTERPVQGAR